jgi:hypothetical protein
MIAWSDPIPEMNTRNETCQLAREKYGPRVKPATLSKWIEELAPLCRYARFRDLTSQINTPHL